MSDDSKCVCGCLRSRHIETPQVPCRGCDDCYEFRPAKEAKPSHITEGGECHPSCPACSEIDSGTTKLFPRSESVYEEAWIAIGVTKRIGSMYGEEELRIGAAIYAGEKAEQRAEKLESERSLMISCQHHSQDNPACGECFECWRIQIINLKQRAEAAERERDDLRNRCLIAARSEVQRVEKL